MRSLKGSYRLLLSLLVCGQVGLSAIDAQAQSAQYKRPKKAPVAKEKTKVKGGAKSKQNSDKLDITDLENKYWAPKDTDFSVVQSRTYSKKEKFAFSLMGGLLVNDSYSTGTVLSFSGSYYFSERSGVEISYITTDSKNNDMTEAFKNQPGSGILPDHGKIQSYYGIGYNWVPVYAKMSVLGKKIVYFDMAVTPGIGMTQYEQQMQDGNINKSALTLSLDLTQYFFFSKHFALRADLKNRWFAEEVIGYAGTNKGTVIRNNTSNTSQFTVGATFYF